MLVLNRVRKSKKTKRLAFKLVNRIECEAGKLQKGPVEQAKTLEEALTKEASAFSKLCTETINLGSSSLLQSEVFVTTLMEQIVTELAQL